MFVVDSSASLSDGDFRFHMVLDFCKRFLLPANIDSDDVRVGFVVFGTDVKQEFFLNKYHSKRDVFAAIDNVKYLGGSTNIPGAIKVVNDEMFLQEKGDRPEVRNIAILLTDGMTTKNRDQLRPEAERAKLNGIHIFVIGIGSWLVTGELKRMASIPYSKNAFVLEGFEELRIFDERFFQFCPRT